MTSEKLINFVVFKYFTTGSAISQRRPRCLHVHKGTVNCAVIIALLTSKAYKGLRFFDEVKGKSSLPWQTVAACDPWHNRCCRDACFPEFIVSPHRAPHTYPCHTLGVSLTLPSESHTLMTNLKISRILYNSLTPTHSFNALHPQIVIFTNKRLLIY